MLKNFIRKISFGLLKMAGPASPNFDTWPSIAGENLPRNISQWLKTFKNHALLYPPVNRIATDISTARWGLYQILDGKKVKIESHAAIDIFDQPSPEFLGYQVRYLLQAWLDLVGEAYLLITGRQQGRPTGLLPVAPHWITRKPSKTYKFYDINVQSGNQIERIVVAASEILRIFNPDPSAPYGGAVGASFALDDELCADTYASKWNLGVFRNGAEASAIIGIDGASDAAIDSLHAKWNEKHQGVWNAHKVSFVNSKDLKSISPWKGQKETEFIKGRDQNRDRTNQAFSIPPEILGIVENSNRATAEAALVMYQHNVLRPRLEAQKAFYNARLLVLFPDTEGLFYDFDNPVQESKSFLLEQAEKSFMRGAITRNEYREQIGMNPTDDEDGYLIPLNMEFVPVGSLPQGKAKPAGGGNGKSKIKNEEVISV